ncbi:hypothetical protein REPUB_Repub07fG0064300 [Reevesia pubescens]
MKLISHFFSLIHLGFFFSSYFPYARSVHSLSFVTVEAEGISGSQPAEVHNLVQGKWTGSAAWNTLVDPLNGEPFIKVAKVNETGIQPFVESLSKCPKHGLHNPFKSPERYLLYGEISAKAARMLSLPKVRFLARSFAVPGNHIGQQSHGYCWPYGPVAIITPFNFPLEIPVLQLMGALYMGNKPVLKVDSKVSIVMEQMMRLLHHCGLLAEDVDFINSDGKTMNKLLMKANPRMTLFTGSSRVAEKLAVDLKGRVKLEDAGFDWKILGPNVEEVDYVAWNSSTSSLISKIKDLAERRKLSDLTIGPVLTVTTEAMLEHKKKLLQISGSKNLKEANYELVTKEIFGAFQIITDYKKDQLPMVLDALERMHAHLTAAVVSNDLIFLQDLIGNTVNGTTYAGLRARTTGAPQNHWFGPAGDPRGAGIGTPEAIKLVWSCHREIIYDFGPFPRDWKIPPST